jgi:hypothetical protein
VASEVAKGVAKATVQASEDIRRKFPAIRQITKEVEKVIPEVLEEAGEAARRSTLSAYGQLITAQEKTPSYRQGAGRMARGAVRSAIGSADFIQVEGNTISFANSAALDPVARQWHRLAFGAGGWGQGSELNVPVKFGDLVLGSMGYSESPSPGFMMPAGVWISPGGDRVAAGANRNGTDMFYTQRDFIDQAGSKQPGRGALKGQGILGRPTGMRPSRGIKGRDFFAAGVRRLATEIPRGLEERTEEAIVRYVATEGGQGSSRVNVD